MKAPTWSEGVERYLSEHSPLYHARGTVERVKSIFGIFGRHAGTDSLLDGITRVSVEGYRRGRVAVGRSAWTINTEVRHLAAFFRWCRDCDLMTVDPLRGVRRLKTTKRRINHAVDPMDIFRIHNRAKSRGKYALADLVILIPNTGLRLCEALMLRVQDVNLELRELWVSGRDGWSPKDKDDRRIPLNERAHDVLRSRVAGARSELLFTTRNSTAFMRRNVLRDLKAVSTALGIRGVSFHGMRHTFATVAAQTMPERMLAAIMGHASVSTTAKYYIDRAMMKLPPPPQVI